ncbi:CDP-glycerol glycerophosphotransferase family protein [Oceanobacillus bengalensis]|uniref:Polyribitolphosphotransferase n=1 Tax=Oceanobacillus bengalensis TaxID=1435466 RepID=A0A494YZX3_9BACI|nr:CDP-glycerol glycerophosphotransferase family protein [Oceanobacillus bengalensis]RKQ15724.1 polyribitolphosphotransferase [Oceanobacillus bengalensis]
MFISPIDQRDIEVISHDIVKSDITNLTLNGPYLEVEGYASFHGIRTFAEDRIRKTLLIVSGIDINEYRKKNEESSELSDEEIIKLNTIEVPLENCKLLNMTYNQEEFIKEDLDLLSGFRGIVDLSTIHNGRPLLSGEYNVYIKLEQLPNDRDNIKYEKIFPISNVKQFMKNNILNTKLENFSAKKVLKYNLVISFNEHSKTLKLKNTLLQSYNPEDMVAPSAKEGKNTKAFKRRFFKLLYMIFCIFPINKKKVVFASDSRSQLNGNLYFVYEELYKRGLGLDIKFMFKERINDKKTIFDLVKLAYQFATSKIILLDDFYPLIYPLNIRKNADLIQVWHAAGAFKTFGYSRIGRPGGPSPRSRNHRNYTKAVVSSEGVRKNYAEGFGITIDKVYSTGVPRSDIFFDEEYKSYVTNTLHSKYPFLKNKKVILFAPTFRGNGQTSAFYPFEILNLKKLYEELHEEYVFLFKIHPFVKNTLTIPYEYNDFFYDFSSYREVNDLLLITDILVTDYSSVCFEFALLDKPMLFFAFDVERYIEERDFYYNYFDFIPGPLVKTTDELTTAIINQNFEQEKIKPFVDYFFNDTLGKASKNVVDQVIIPSLEDNLNDDNEREKAVLVPPASRIDLFEQSLEEDNK